MGADIRQVLASALVSVLMAPIPAAAGAQPGDIRLKMTLTHDKDGQVRTASILIFNRHNGIICLDYNYAASTRINAARGAKFIPSPTTFEGRPKPGCIEVPPGGTRSHSYNLTRIWPGISLAKARLCYHAAWQRGTFAERGSYRSKSVCRYTASQ